MYRAEDRKRLLLVLGLLSLVLLVMPSASAKFTGQHAFIGAQEVQCTKCHPSVGQELQSHKTHNFTVTGITDGACRVCHVIRAGGSLNNSYPGGTSPYHAAALIECTYCHGELAGQPTGYGTNPIPGANVTAEFENGADIEAHFPLYNRSKLGGTTDFLKGANEACIACHTEAANVTVYEPSLALKINASLTNASKCTSADCFYSAGGVGNKTFMWEIKIEVNQSF